LPVSLTLISAVVTPLTVNVGQNLVQQFTAIAVPDDAPQTFTWSQPTCTNGTNCGTISYDPNSSGVAVYTAGDVNQSVVVAATSTVSPSGVAQAKVAVVTSRLPSGTYAFQFSGYDPSNNPVAAAGSFILTSSGTITAGIEDVLSASGPQQYPIASVSYTPIDGSNNLGTLTVALTEGPTNEYTAVLTSSGIIRMIESDGLGTGSGVLQESAKNTVFNAGAQNFVFGFTGVNKATGGTRVGYIGLLPLNGTSGITGGLVDANDYPNVTPICSSPPCSIASNSSYSQPNAANLPTWWEMTLITAAGTQHFDFFVSAGQTSNQTNPLTLYAISTDPIDATHPALSGSMAYQWPGTSKSPITYNNAGFNGTSVSNLTGTNANVSLTLGRTDGTSGGSGGTGGFTGNFDWNNDGTIVSVDPTPSDTTIHFTYTYVATPINSTQYVGRYTFQMLGNPLSTPVVPPLPFILYASGANRGFLLDQSSSAVITGSMIPQPSVNNFEYTGTEMPGTYAAATISNSKSSIVPVVQNLLLTSTGYNSKGQLTLNVAGTENPGSVTLTGSYTIANNPPGLGAITLTTPATTYVMYAIDASAISGTSSDVITDFMIMGTCSPQPCSTAPPSSIIFAQQ